MVFGYEAPEAAVGTVVTVVAHHPVIIHLEGVLCGLFAIDEYLVTYDLEFVVLEDLDDTFV